MITEQEYQRRRRQLKRARFVRMSIYVYIPLTLLTASSVVAVGLMWLH